MVLVFIIFKKTRCVFVFVCVWHREIERDRDNDDSMIDSIVAVRQINNNRDGIYLFTSTHTHTHNLSLSLSLLQWWPSQCVLISFNVSSLFACVSVSSSSIPSLSSIFLRQKEETQRTARRIKIKGRACECVSVCVWLPVCVCVATSMCGCGTTRG